MMRLICLASIIALAAIATSQGGLGGQAGGMQGRDQQNYDGWLRAIERDLATYLDGDEIKNILTPGEYSEWPLTLKDGQVVIAEARSDAFDPALEVVDDKGKVLASNDDRFPGDQRPLLLWHCEKGGTYAIRGRCFHDKSGGQFFLRFKIYDSIDLAPDKFSQRLFESRTQFLFRVPMKAGQIKKINFAPLTRGGEIYSRLERYISPVGLPYNSLADPIQVVIPQIIMAPVDGDYYVLAVIGGRNQTVRADAKDLALTPVTAEGMKAKVNIPAVWSLSVKAGEMLQVATPELNLDSRIVIAEQPDVSKYALDLKKPEANPFFPHPAGKEPDKGPAFTVLPARARDGRLAVFAARRDAKLWIASNSYSEKSGDFTLSIKPAPTTFAEATQAGGQLRIGNTDYWALDAKVGDVMTFSSKSTGFASQLVVRDPDLGEIWNANALPDQDTFDWNIIVQKPGRYLIAVSSLGDGGGGQYSLFRKTIPAKEFGKGAPAETDLIPGQVQVWKFTALPNQPLLVHWRSTNWDYQIDVRDEKGAEIGWTGMQSVDSANRYGILSVGKPTTYLLVFTPRSKSHVTIALSDLPGRTDK